MVRTNHEPNFPVGKKKDQTRREGAEKKIAPLKEKLRFEETLFVSALQGDGMEELLEQIRQYLPAEPPYYPKEDLSEHPIRFFVSELIREQLYLLFHEEIPYSCTDRKS